MALIEILTLKPMTNAGNLRALASVRVGKVIIHDFRIVREDGKTAFAQPPIRPWIDKATNKQKYGGPLVELPQETMEEIGAALIDRWMAGSNGGQ